MGATTTARPRREREGFFEKYIQGKGIDIGAGTDPLTASCKVWDVFDGDAQLMQDLPNESFDWVYSSHCLEHIIDPSAALQRWWDLVKPGGYLIISVPDEDLYELGMWPSHMNTDHKTSWNVDKEFSWSPVSRSLLGELKALHGGQIEYVRQVSEGYDSSLLQAAIAHIIIDDHFLAKAMEKTGRIDAEMLNHRSFRVTGFWPIDQTTHPFNAEASVEGIVRKAAHV